MEAAKGAREEALMLTRRDILKQAGTMVGLATTAPWWLVRRAHAARREKLIVWNQIAQAPVVDRLMKEQCYAYAKQAGIKEHELQYVEIGTGQLDAKIPATLEAGNPPDVCRGGQGREPGPLAAGAGQQPLPHRSGQQPLPLPPV